MLQYARETTHVHTRFTRLQGRHLSEYCCSEHVNRERTGLQKSDKRFIPDYGTAYCPVSHSQVGHFYFVHMGAVP